MQNDRNLNEREWPLGAGVPVRFTPASGNSGAHIHYIAGHEQHNGLLFYRLEEMPGALFLRENLEVVMDLKATEAQGTDENRVNKARPSITGYRNLADFEIGLINAVKEVGNAVGGLVTDMEGKSDIDKRWVSIAKTHLQQGFMALTRAVAKPDSF